MKKLLLRAALVLLGLGLTGVLVEGTAGIVLSFREATGAADIRERSHCRHDPRVGWTNVEGARVEDIYGEGIHLSINARGFRGPHETPDAVPEGKYRVVFIGDSFTMGYGVGDGETFPAQLTRNCTDVDAVNLGLGGYGVDQAYLRYLEQGESLDKHGLVLAVIRDDFRRMLTTRFAGRYEKPRIRVGDAGAIEVENVPVPDRWGGSTTSLLRRIWGATSTRKLLRPSRRDRHGSEIVWPEPRGEDFAAAAEAIVHDLAKRTHAKGLSFALVYLPDRQDLEGNQAALYPDWLRGVADAASAPFVDLVPAFQALSPSDRRAHFLDDGHYTVLGNALVADVLHAELARAWPSYPCR